MQKRDVRAFSVGMLFETTGKGTVDPIPVGEGEALTGKQMRIGYTPFDRHF